MILQLRPKSSWFAELCTNELHGKWLKRQLWQKVLKLRLFKSELDGSWGGKSIFYSESYKRVEEISLWDRAQFQKQHTWVGIYSQGWRSVDGRLQGDYLHYLQGKGDFFLIFIFIYLFGCVRLWRVGYSSLTRDGTQAPCFWSTET